MHLAPRWILALSLAAACGDNVKPEAALPDAATLAATCSEADVASTLRALPGVTEVVERDCADYVQGSPRCYGIAFDQLIDHADPQTAHFTQHLFLIHRGCERPNLVADWGYSQHYFFDDELSVLYQTNALWIEHRFQGASVPERADWDWSALTIRNGASDMHRIIAAFQQHYGANWVSTGASKGGITASYHHYLFPDDLDGAIPYVAPASRGPIDPIYQTYLDRVLPAPCAADIRTTQVAALTTRRAAMLQRLAALGYDDPLYLDYLVGSADWAFWQYYGVDACGEVPTALASDDAVWGFLARLSGFGARRAPATVDEEWSWGALYYEWLTEQGFALQTGAHIAPHLSATFREMTMEQNFRLMFPDVALPPHSYDVTAHVRRWARDRADNLLLIYGEYDPWSGGAMAEPTQPTSARFFVPAATHGAAISYLDPDDEAAALAHASRMLGVAPVPLRQEARRAVANRQTLLEHHVRGQQAIDLRMLGR